MELKNINTTDKRRRIFEDYANTINENSKVKDEKAAKIAGFISGNKNIKSNKESKSIILDFIDNVDISLLMAIFTMFGTIITTGISLYRGLRKFSDGRAFNNGNDYNRNNSFRNKMFESEEIEIYEPIEKYEPLTSAQIHNLYESEEFQNLNEKEQLQLVEEISEQSMFDVLTNDNLLFKFECGAEMEVLYSDKLSHLPFSLRFFANQSENVNDFINKINDFFGVIGKNLTDFDKEALTKHYNKYK